jgi:hypothetical protein
MLHSPSFNPLNAELNPICHLLALFGAHHILHVSRVGVKIPSVESVNQLLSMETLTWDFTVVVNVL